MIDDIKFFFDFILTEVVAKWFKDIIFYIFLGAIIIFLYEHLTIYNWKSDFSHGVYKFCFYSFLGLLLFRCYFIVCYYGFRKNNDQIPLFDEDFRGYFLVNILVLHYLEREEAGLIAWGSGAVYVLAGILLFFL